MVMRINKIITYMKMICFSNKFSQLIFIKELYGEHLKGILKRVDFLFVIDYPGWKKVSFTACHSGKL